MTKQEVLDILKENGTGVFKIYFIESDYIALASIGVTRNGTPWYACSNWISGVPSYDFDGIVRIEVITTWNQENQDIRKRRKDWR